MILCYRDELGVVQVELDSSGVVFAAGYLYGDTADGEPIKVPMESLVALDMK